MKSELWEYLMQTWKIERVGLLGGFLMMLFVGFIITLPTQLELREQAQEIELTHDLIVSSCQGIVPEWALQEDVWVEVIDHTTAPNYLTVRYKVVDVLAVKSELEFTLTIERTVKGFGVLMWYFYESTDTTWCTL